MVIVTYISKIVLLLILTTTAYMDIKTQHIPIIFIGISLTLGIITQILLEKFPFYNILLGCGIGIFLIGLAFVSNQSIGYGDGMMFIVSGAFLGLTDNLWLLLFSMGLSAIASIVLMIIFKFHRKMRIPFLPFMFCGYICMLALG